VLRAAAVALVTRDGTRFLSPRHARRGRVADHDDLELEAEVMKHRRITTALLVLGLVGPWDAATLRARLND
jgi:hypothetical protein